MVDVFDDRVELTSPGALPNHKTAESVVGGGPPRSRNESIADYLLVQRLMEQRGTGFPRIRAAMRAFNGTEPRLDANNVVEECGPLLGRGAQGRAQLAQGEAPVFQAWNTPELLDQLGDGDGAGEIGGREAKLAGRFEALGEGAQRGVVLGPAVLMGAVVAALEPREVQDAGGDREGQARPPPRGYPRSGPPASGSDHRGR